MTTPVFLPSLGMTGLWSLNAPYSSLILSTAQYKCVSIVSLQGAIAQGLDPLNNVYLANQDTKASFENDLANDDYLITIASGPGDVVTFPRSAMASMPTAEGEIYRNVMLGVVLSAIPDSMDLSSLQNEIQALVLSSLGVSSSVYLAQIGASTMLTTQQAAILNAARKAAQTTPASTMYQNEQLQAQVTALQEKVQILSQYIAQHFVSA